MANKIKLLTMGFSLMILAGCASSASLMGDYPSYTEKTLLADAEIIVEGTVVGQEATVLKPRFEGETAEENPLFGLSDSEIRAALSSGDGVPATLFTLRVEFSHEGPARDGETITIVQTGGKVNGVDYVIDAEPPLKVGEKYLLFAREGHQDVFVILGGSAGMLVESTAGRFEAVLPERSPYQVLTRELVSNLTAP
jgi:hypothetical protein